MVRCGGLVLLGAVLTVIAAWVPAVWYGLYGKWHPAKRSVPTREEVHWWNATVSPGIDDKVTEVARPAYVTIGFDSALMLDPSRVYDDIGLRTDDREWSQYAIAHRWRSGLPLRSLGCDAWALDFAWPAAASDWHGGWRWAFDVNYKSEMRTVTLPLRPLWPGFALDTVFFAAVSGVILFGWRGLVRRRRLRRGRCPACAYPIGSSAVCTECGEALAGRGAAAMIPAMPSS